MTNKTSAYIIFITVLFGSILAKWRATMEKHAPLGYEDENGFHFGAEPIRSTDK